MMLFFRADGGRAIGFGHLMRCHALAQEARRRDLSPVFLTRPDDGTGLAKLKALGEMTVPLVAAEDNRRDLEAALGAIRLATRGSPRGAILITDHNALDAAWLVGARQAGLVVVSLNDLPKIHYASHLVVNGNLGAEKLRYDAEPGVRFLLGPDYFFFRDEFLAPGVARTEHAKDARRVVISLGAGDPRNVTQAVLEALSAVDDKLELTVITGAAYGFGASLEEAAARSPHTVEIARDLAETARAFGRGEIAVCAGGSTAYEVAILGIPAVVLVLSETQRDAASALGEAGTAVCIRDADASRAAEAVTVLLGDVDRRRRMGEQGRAIFDGQGRTRVLNAVEALRQEQRGSPGGAA
jgi:UDP-2,4-diacetamido-2,4,6-trideoxy-beta-L-altropyranose hydrolase